MTREEIDKKRSYLTVKSNTLIQQSRFKLSLAEQKTIAYICSMIVKPKWKDKGKLSPGEFKLDYEFNIWEYCKVCGFTDSGTNLKNVRDTLQGLRNKSMWVNLTPKHPNRTTLVGWLQKVWIDDSTGITHIEIDRDLAPYLFALGEKFTQYELYNVLAMKSSYSVRLYEILRSYTYRGGKNEEKEFSHQFDLAEFKDLLAVSDIKSYSRFPDLRRYVLDIAVKEINELSDLAVSYTPINKGRKTVAIRFTMRNKEPFLKHQARWNVEKVLEKQGEE